MKKIAVLRPEPSNQSTITAAKKLGLDPFALPIFEVKKLDWKAPDPKDFDGLLLTSSNAIRHAGDELEKLKSLPVYAVGPATAKAAKDAGFKIARIGGMGIAKLLKNIPHDLKLIHLVGEDRLEYRLAWQKIEPITVYESADVKKVDGSVLDGTVTMVHSPRAGMRLAEIAKDKASIRVVAISKQAADACGEGWEKLAYVKQPHDALMLALAAKLCDKPETE
jgi:uroporphyrinogen-III synthase